jgi:hypothetical protein
MDNIFYFIDDLHQIYAERVNKSELPFINSLSKMRKGSTKKLFIY